MVTPSSDKGKLATPLVARLNLVVECSLAHSIYGECAALLKYFMRVRSVSKCNTWERRQPGWPHQSGCSPGMYKPCWPQRRRRPDRRARSYRDGPACEKRIAVDFDGAG